MTIPPDTVVGESAPEGMTPEKLRVIADWFDTYDKLAEFWIKGIPAVQYPKDSQRFIDAIAAVRGKSVQDDLRRWADQLDARDRALAEANAENARLTAAVQLAERALRSRPMQAFRSTRDQSLRAEAIDVCRAALATTPSPQGGE